MCNMLKMNTNSFRAIKTVYFKNRKLHYTKSELLFGPW